MCYESSKLPAFLLPIWKQQLVIGQKENQLLNTLTHLLHLHGSSNVESKITMHQSVFSVAQHIQILFLYFWIFHLFLFVFSSTCILGETALIGAGEMQLRWRGFCAGPVLSVRGKFLAQMVARTEVVALTELGQSSLTLSLRDVVHF